MRSEQKCARDQSTAPSGRARAFVIACVVTGLTVPAVVFTAPPGPQDGGLRFLEAYERGTPVVITVGELPALITDLKRVASSWVEADPARAQLRRRLVGLAPLELAAALPSQRRPAIVEWACDFLRRGESDEFVRIWMLAASSLLGELPIGEAAQTHIKHARAKFPLDPSLRLAEILTRPEAVTVANTPDVDERRLAQATWHGQVSGLPRRMDIRQTTEMLESLSTDPLVGLEATIHLGLLEFLRGQPDRGLPRFQLAARQADDRYLQNLASLMLGLSSASRGDSASARAAYRAAVDALPTTTAATALAVSLFLSGARPEAASVLDAAYGSSSALLDPWHDPAGSKRHFPRYLTKLRAAAGIPSTQSAVEPRISVGDDLSLPGRPLDGTKVTSTNTLAPNSNQAVFRSVTRSVMVDIAVYDRKVPVTGLTIDDFEVFDNGVRQAVTARSIDQVPLDVSIVLDMNDPSFLLPSGEPSRWQPAQALADVVRIAGLLKPDDRIRLLVAGLDGSVQPLPLQPAAAAVRQGARISIMAASGLNSSTLFDMTAAAIISSPPPDRRGLVLVFTDGIDGASVVTPEQLVSVARESDVVVYLARRYTSGEQFRQRNPRSMSMGPELDWMLRPIPPTAIEAVVEATGGLLRHPAATESMVSFFEKVIDDFRQRYLFHYTPTDVTDRGWHTITVRLKKAERYTVTARRGYFGG